MAGTHTTTYKTALGASAAYDLYKSMPSTLAAGIDPLAWL